MGRTSPSKLNVRLLGVGAAPALGERAHDACLELLGGDRGGGAGNDDFGQAAGVEIDDLVRQHRLDHAARRHAAGLAEVGRAEDRHVGRGAGVLDEIANAHDLADHRDR